MLDELLRHDLVANGQVLFVEDLLEVALNELLVSLRRGSSFIVPTTTKEV
jgi:hypothetical protein